MQDRGSSLFRERAGKTRRRTPEENARGGCRHMGKLVFGMMQSLDGYVAGADGSLEPMAPGPALSSHFNDHVRGLAGILYGRRMYEVMRYWDEDQADWDAGDRDFAAAWRAQPKWVVSRSLKSVGANATLVANDVEAFVKRLKRERRRHHQRRRTRAGGKPHRSQPHRRVSALLSTVGARRRQTVLRGRASAAPSRRHRSRRRGSGEAHARPHLMATFHRST